MVCYAEAVSVIDGIRTQSHTWTSGSIHVTVAQALTIPTEKEINLTDTIGRGKNVPKPASRNDTNCHWLMPKFNVNSESFRQKEIYPIIMRACHIAGFKVHGSYEKNTIRYDSRA